MATQFDSAAAAKARYDAIANGLLNEDATGTKFGHNQIGLDKNGQFSTFDLKYKQGDPNALKQQGSSVSGALNNLVKEFGLDASKIQGTQVGDYEALGSVRYDPGAGVKRSARQAFDEIFNRHLKDQFDAKFAGAGNTTAAPPKAAASAPPAPLGYGQPNARPQPQQPQAPAQDMGQNPFQGQNLAPPPPAAPQQNMTPSGPGFQTPGWQGPERRYNDVPTGPSLVQATPQATSGRDPYMEYLAPVYRPVTTGTEAYDQMGLDLMSRYGFGAEHSWFPNSGDYKIK